MLRTYRYRLYQNKIQRERIRKNTDACRFVYNWAFIAVGRFEATSQLWSACGFKYNALTLLEKEWICPKCHKQHDRDFNAAQNIKMIGLRSIMTPREPREEPVELSALAEALKQQAPTFRAGGSSQNLVSLSLKRLLGLGVD